MALQCALFRWFIQVIQVSAVCAQPSGESCRNPELSLWPPLPQKMCTHGRRWLMPPANFQTTGYLSGKQRHCLERFTVMLSRGWIWSQGLNEGPGMWLKSQQPPNILLAIITFFWDQRLCSGDSKIRKHLEISIWKSMGVKVRSSRFESNFWHKIASPIYLHVLILTIALSILLSSFKNKKIIYLFIY